MSSEAWSRKRCDSEERSSPRGSYVTIKTYLKRYGEDKSTRIVKARRQAFPMGRDGRDTLVGTLGRCVGAS